MTVPELITTTLGCIRSGFYSDRAREFMRDERALTKAITRYGYECKQRGWEFETDFIFKDILGVLNSIKDKQLGIGYLPVYLHGAISQHVGQRAEELRAASQHEKARGISKVKQMVEGVQVVHAVVAASNVDMLSAFYLHTNELQKQRRAQKKKKVVKPRETQEALL